MAFESSGQWTTQFGSECEVCKHKAANYRCPKCGIVYCNVECYKQHNENCVARFTEDFLSSLPKKETSQEVKIRTQRMLESASSATEAVEPWKPWWIKAVIPNPPKPQQDPPKKVSPLMRYHLFDAMYGYCYMMRLYNGDISFDPEGAFNVLCSISTALSTKTKIQSIAHSTSLCIEASKRPDLFVEFQWQIEILTDVKCCLQTVSHCQRALSEMISLASIVGDDFIYAKLQFYFCWTPLISCNDLEQLREEVSDHYLSLNALLSDIN